MRNTPHPVELVITHLSKRLYRVFSKKAEVTCAFMASSATAFAPFLTEFERSPVLWIGPCTTRAIKAFLLIDHGQ